MKKQITTPENNNLLLQEDDQLSIISEGTCKRAAGLLGSVVGERVEIRETLAAKSKRKQTVGQELHKLLPKIDMVISEFLLERGCLRSRRLW